MGEEMTPEEVQALLERERAGRPRRFGVLQSMSESTNGVVDGYSEYVPEIELRSGRRSTAADAPAPKPGSQGGRRSIR